MPNVGPYIYMTLAFLALLGAPYICEISSLRVKSPVFYKTLYTSDTMLTKTINPFETKYPCQPTGLPNLLHKVIMPQQQESVPMTEIHVLMHVFMLTAAIHGHTPIFLDI